MFSFAIIIYLSSSPIILIKKYWLIIMAMFKKEFGRIISALGTEGLYDHMVGTFSENRLITREKSEHKCIII